LDDNLFDDDELEGGLELEEESKSKERWRKLTLSILACMQRKWRKTWREVGQAVHEEWLAWAIQQGHVCIVLPLLRERSAADLERMPHELMVSAGRAGSLGLLALLHPHISVDAADSRAMAALHYACLNGHAEAVRWLLQHGAEVNQVNEIGKTPLMFAAEGGHDQVVRVLLEHGADPLATTREDLKSDLYSHHRQDLTALHFAARSGSVETARALVRAGADACTASHRMSFRPQDGRTPLEIAAAKGDVPLVELLLDLLATSVHPAAAKEDAVRKSLAAATAKGHTNVLVLLASNNQPDQSSQ
jgi:ankyrin repeat protein